MPLSPSEVQSMLGAWPMLDGASVSLLNHSENETFLLHGQQGRFTLRVHRVDYQSVPAIESELAWLHALGNDTAILVPRALQGSDGRWLQHVRTADGRPRCAVAFAFIDGAEPDPQADLRDLFTTLGMYAATMHRHVTAWQPPPGFERPSWTAETILPKDGLWGDWRRAPGLDGKLTELLSRVAVELAQRLGDYGTGADRFGLIHADMRLGNILVDGSRTTVIDFDDCGFGWFMYDFAAAVSFHEASPAVPALREAWLKGYRAVRPLSAADLGALDAMVMLRRMALLAWIGSHGETALARSHMPGYAQGTAELARRFLRGAIWS